MWDKKNPLLVRLRKALNAKVREFQHYQAG